MKDNRKSTRIALRTTEDEREMFHELGKRLNRSSSDAVRALVREALEILQEKEKHMMVSGTPPVGAA